MLLKRWSQLLIEIVLISFIVACNTASTQQSSMGFAQQTPVSAPSTTTEAAAPSFSVLITFAPVAREAYVSSYNESELSAIIPLFRTNNVLRIIPDVDGETDLIEEFPPGTSQITISYAFTNKSNSQGLALMKLSLLVVKLIPVNFGGLAAYGVPDQPSATIYETYERGPVLSPGVSWPFTRTFAVPGCGLYEQTFGFGSFYQPNESRMYIMIPDPTQPGCDFRSILARAKYQ